jgi:hypothetical protein
MTTIRNFDARDEASAMTAPSRPATSGPEKSRTEKSGRRR